MQEEQFYLNFFFYNLKINLEKYKKKVVGCQKQCTTDTIIYIIIWIMLNIGLVKINV